MAEGIVKKCQEAVGRAWELVKQGCTKVEEGYNYLGRKVNVLSDKHLPPQISQIAKEAYRGLFYTAALFLVPAPLAVLVAGVANLAVITLLASDVIGTRTAARLLIGIRNFCVIQAGIQAVKFAITANPLYITTALGCTALALATELSIIRLRETGVRVH